MGRRKPDTGPDDCYIRSSYHAGAERERNSIGKKIAAARHAAGLSLASFTALLKDYGVTVTASSASKWEMGLTVPSAYQLLAISKALKLADPFLYFCGDEAGPKDEALYIVLDKELNKEGRKKIEEFRKILIASGLYKP